MEAKLNENLWEQVLELIKIGSPILFHYQINPLIRNAARSNDTKCEGNVWEVSEIMAS